MLFVLVIWSNLTSLLIFCDKAVEFALWISLLSADVIIVCLDRLQLTVKIPVALAHAEFCAFKNSHKNKMTNYCRGLRVLFFSDDFGLISALRKAARTCEMKLK